MFATWTTGRDCRWSRGSDSPLAGRSARRLAEGAAGEAAVNAATVRSSGCGTVVRTIMVAGSTAGGCSSMMNAAACRRGGAGCNENSEEDRFVLHDV